MIRLSGISLMPNLSCYNPSKLTLNNARHSSKDRSGSWAEAVAGLYFPEKLFVKSSFSFADCWKAKFWLSMKFTKIKSNNCRHMSLEMRIIRQSSTIRRQETIKRLYRIWISHFLNQSLKKSWKCIHIKV